MITSTTDRPDGAPAASRLLDLEQVTGLLHSLLPRDWPGPPGDVRIERCWPAANDGFIVQWSFTLGSDQRYALYARSIDEAAEPAPETAGDASSRSRPSVTEWGLRGVLSYLPQHGLMVHTPDCDPAMPHLAKCLDEVRAAESLASFWKQDGTEADRESLGVHCRLIGYKPGRRAAICYETKSNNGTGQRILGKTYRKHQAERLARLHYHVNDQLRNSADGEIRVSSPLVCVPELQLALFRWAPGEAQKERSTGPAGSLATAVRALAALHGTTVEGLETFTVRDECAILQRWHRALTATHPRMASRTAPLLATLLQQSQAIDPSRSCTIHRDFYETQFVTSGGVTTLLDLDTLCVGHPCLDLGNFLAHLYLQVLRQGDEAELGHLLEETTKQYEGMAGRVDPEALDFYLNSSLFRLAAVHAFRTQTSGFAEPIQQLVQQRLDRCVKGR